MMDLLREARKSNSRCNLRKEEAMGMKNQYSVIAPHSFTILPFSTFFQFFLSSIAYSMLKRLSLPC
jgi:hypothetical protein